MEIEVRVVALVPDYRLGSVIVALQETSGDRMLPISVGLLEGGAIFMCIEKTKTPRPLTHELFKNVLSKYAISVEKAVINNVDTNIFYALLHTKHAGHTQIIDARPSDAIAIALRFGCPIYVESLVFEKAKAALQQDETADEAYGRMLDALDPEKMPKA